MSLISKGRIAGSAAMVFGLLTIFSGSQALFGSQEMRSVFGNVVPFVLWFNFVAGFAYVVAGVALFVGHPWASGLSTIVAAATILVFLAFGYHIYSGGSYELRTVGAMATRTAFWVFIAFLARRLLQPLATG